MLNYRLKINTKPANKSDSMPAQRYKKIYLKFDVKRSC